MSKRNQQRDTNTQQAIPLSKKTKTKSLSSLENNNTSSSVQDKDDRLNPKLRGIHKDAIQADVAPSSRATCVDCETLIHKGEPRWGIKYAGNPLPEPVIPLYGSHPMVMWCHAGGCGLSYCRQQTNSNSVDDTAEQRQSAEASRVCHYCSDVPDDVPLRLLCGGNSKGNKIRQHAFHIHCWREAISQSKNLTQEQKSTILIPAYEIGTKCHVKSRLSWDDLTVDEKIYVRKHYQQPSRNIVLEKIVSGGQTGVDQAALDVAIQLGVNYGGWIPKGRKTETGPLNKKYENMQEMKTETYEARTEQNVMDSDGTLIFYRDNLTGGTAYTRQMVEKHGKEMLLMNISCDLSADDAGEEIALWLEQQKMKILNVAGPRASSDTQIYDDAKHILNSALSRTLMLDNYS